MTHKRQGTRDQLREMAVADDWYRSTLDRWGEKLYEEWGISDVSIQFSGFWSQGDGASFIGFVNGSANLQKFLQKLDAEEQVVRHGELVLLGIADYVYDCASIGIVRTGSHYVHENTVSAELRMYMAQALSDEQFDRACSLMPSDQEITEAVRALCREIYRELEQEYDCLTSDEVINEMAEANDWEIVG